MVIRSVKSILSGRRRGALITEVVIAMGILTFAMLPLAFSFVREQKLTRAYFNRAIVMEIIDGEMEALMAGEWRAFTPGAQTYPVRAEAAKSLPPGKFVLTLASDRVRLEWLPAKSGKGGPVVREGRVMSPTSGTAGGLNK
jgi:hypothetical protein